MKLRQGLRECRAQMIHNAQKKMVRSVRTKENFQFQKVKVKKKFKVKKEKNGLTSQTNHFAKKTEVKVKTESHKMPTKEKNKSYNNE